MKRSIENTENQTRRQRLQAKKRRQRWVTWTLAALAVVLMVVLIIWGTSNRLSDTGHPAQAASTYESTTTVSQTSSTTGQVTAVGAEDSGATPASETVSTTTSQKTTTTTSTAQATGSVAAAPVVRHGPTDHKWIALTFDDNYQLDTAFATLAVLTKYQVPATMFVIGHYVDLGPKLAKQIAADGFEVGDHTRSHADCTALSKNGLRIEIGNSTDHYRTLTGAATVPLFRPPGGSIDQKTCEVAAEKGFRYVVTWDIDTNDWRGRTAAQITETVMSDAHNGAIVLMHMAAKHTAEALPEIVTRLRAEGYELVTLTKMLGI